MILKTSLSVASDALKALGERGREDGREKRGEGSDSVLCQALLVVTGVVAGHYMPVDVYIFQIRPPAPPRGKVGRADEERARGTGSRDLSIFKLKTDRTAPKIRGCSRDWHPLNPRGVLRNLQGMGHVQ